MNRDKTLISANQAAILLFVFLTCSSITNIPSPLIGLAGNAAWISLLVSASLGLLLLVPVAWLARAYPGQSLIECSRAVIGTPVTLLLGCMFLSFLFDMGPSIVLDIAMFLKSSMLRETPAYWFIFPTFLVVGLSVRTGIDKLAGLFPVLMGNVMFFVFLIAALSANNFDPRQLLPIMPEGVRPMLHGTYFSFGFPFGEAVIFTMILQHAKKGGKLGPKLALGLAASLLSLAAATVVTIMVFGPIAGERKYSLFELARTVSIIDVFQRIEALIGYSLIVASFMKATLVLFAAHETLIHMIGLKKDKMLVMPMALLMSCIAMSGIDMGDASWIFQVNEVHPIWNAAFFILPVLIVFFAALLRGKKPAPAAAQKTGPGGRLP
ncbi:GerAB/ArcD/ProY family transporter [Paenibacillus humicola]|uniref:GerAB/ArcD/ProY family transporter n=1 Tax=Paenibacillus humicola TaxID=3110540 RepID=UPI00237A58EB|nr:endospore germination permease [Paenibacillus humicola]